MNVRVPFNWLMAISLLSSSVAVAQAPNAQYDQGQGGYGTSPYAGEQYYPAAAMEPQWEQYPASDLYSELVPYDRSDISADDARMFLNFREMLRGSWLRLEYVQGDFLSNGGTTMGEGFFTTLPNGSLSTETDDFTNPGLLVFTDLTDPLEPVTTTAYGQSVNTKGVKWRNAQAIRSGFGVPITKNAWLEGNFLIFTQQSEVLNAPTLPVPGGPVFGGELDGEIFAPAPNGQHGTIAPTFIVLPTLLNGQIADFTRVYDMGFSSYYESRYKGGNIDLAFNWITPEIGFRAQPILGYRHEQYAEGLGLQYVRSDFDELDPQVAQVSKIRSVTRNQRDQVEFGLRNELAMKYVTFGVQEKFGLGTNNVNANVVSNLQTIGDTPDADLRTSQRKVVFAPSFDLDVYAKVRVNEWMNLRVGYNLLLMGNLGVADKSIYWNQTGTTDALVNDIRTNLNYDHRAISSLTLGGEIVLP
ncbi:BBP7 family outer membrane beta-barrel protein [Planctomicrobium sp. SH668]|uniref:BBP7 family outer membrane beta-barrel protein n=1 Tax=Planctomicrobium sp. SH668 TaxID=3448126 RepID=UPI003F5C9194